MKRLRQVCLGATLASIVWLSSATPAHSAPSEKERAAEQHSKAARKQYRDGNYAEAVAEFERALALYPNPVLLFNLAQAHRRNGSSERAIFYFKSYLAMVPRGGDRPEVERRIRDLEAALATGTNPIGIPGDDAIGPGAAASPGAGSPASPAPAPDDKAPSPTLANAPPAPGPTELAAAPAPSEAEAEQQLQQFDVEDLIEDEPEQPRSTPSSRVRLLARAGLGFPNFGGKSVRQASNQFAFASALSATFALPLGPQALHLGLAASYTPVSYRNVMTASPELSHLLGGFVLADLTFPLGESLALGPSLALGVVWWTGIGNNNVFTASQRGTGGAVPMPSVRLGLPLLWRAGAGWVVGIEPSWSFSKPTAPDLSDGVPGLRWWTVNGVVGIAL
jgi:hypothetical protein